MDTNGSTIEALQSSVETALRNVRALSKAGKLPVELAGLLAIAPDQGLSVNVSLRHREGQRQIRRTADASNWDQARDGLWIEYRPASGVPSPEETAPRAGVVDVPPQAADNADDLVSALLALQEIQAQRQFIALKWFRDQYLPSCDARWAERGPQERQAVLAELIRRNWVLTRKLPNPKSPAFPVTAIEVNRGHPDVVALLEAHGRSVSRFHPVPIAGEPLSATVLSERR